MSHSTAKRQPMQNITESTPDVSVYTSLVCPGLYKLGESRFSVQAVAFSAADGRRNSLWTRPARVQSPWEARIIRCKNLALYIRDCESLCLSDETVKAVGPFYLVSMPGPGEVKYPTQGVNV